ncbi:hypothetical protein TRFO_33239 [Tritrichomonas foetus]|uniref:Uncharacterized protein n=1 Tax=Tritrichomonas foetus TaxID=1144522 RepID=A0A1J4JN88_9EUKA|nr:hypothetical protein TRFO_33239 [Tritrichomonas foetus]|eukprot:OHT00162.1 hypothetical protein TRFO_33239 [Tritrichomonas foetus]
MSGKHNSTISTPSIMVKLIERRNFAGKKITLPNDLKSFKRQIEIVLGLKQPVMSLYNENGEQIYDVNQILPSTTILASTKSNDIVLANRPQQNSTKISNDGNNDDGDLSYESDEGVQSDGENINSNTSKGANRNSNKNLNRSINDDDDGNAYAKITLNNRPSNNHNANKRNNQPAQSRSKFVTASQVETENELRNYIEREQEKDENYLLEDEEEEEEIYENYKQLIHAKQQNQPKPKQNSHQNSNQNQNSHQKLNQNQNSQNQRRGLNNRNQNRSSNKPNNSTSENDNDLLKSSDDDDYNENEYPDDQNDESNSNIMQPQEEQQKIVSDLLGPQFSDDRFQEIISNAFSQLDAKSQNAFKNAAIEETHQQQYAFQNLLSSLSQYTTIMDRENLTLCQEIIDRVNEIISHYRTITTGCIAYNFKSIIVGPRHSGKSTILSFLVEQFLTELCLTQTWKRNFIFMFDAKKLAVSFSSYLDFYNAFIDLIFNSVKIQRPGFVPYVESVSNYFKSIPQNSDKPILPKRFETNEDFRGAARSLKQIGMELYKCIQDPSAFMAWHTNVLLMPSLVASAFGFTQIHYFIDNAEYLDAQFTPSHPFVDSSDDVDIVEYFKYAISNGSFVMSCENIDEFLDVFGPREESVDLIHGVDFEDVFGFSGEVYGSDKAFMVKFENDPRTFKFTASDCGGCPAFLSFWEEMCREVDANQDDWNVNVTDYNEQQMSVKSYLEHILQHVFVVEDESNESKRVVQQPILEIHPIKNVV